MSAENALATLAQDLRRSRAAEPGDAKPVFWLGAGCSVYDGIPLNDALLDTLLPDAPGAWGSKQYRFDAYVRGWRQLDRAALFRPQFDRAPLPDSPYHGLAALLSEGYADLVFTFNIDDLLEQALRQAGLRQGSDYLVVRVPEVAAGVATTHLRSPGPRIRIVMLHGHHGFGFNYMTSDEITEYNDEITRLVGEYSARKAVVCGYSFFHLNVLRSFSAAGGRLFYVNPAFPEAPMILSLMYARNRGDAWFVDGPLGRFDAFVADLRRRLA